MLTKLLALVMKGDVGWRCKQCSWVASCSVDSASIYLRWRLTRPMRNVQ